MRPERVTRTFGRHRWETWEEREQAPAELRYLERLPLGTPYVEVVRKVAAVARLEGLGRGRKKLVVDATGVGTPVVEMLRAARTGCDLKPVVITSGTGERYGSGTYYVAKTDLMTGLRTSLELQDVAIASRLAETPALVKELAGFGGSGHDDMVMALALALWGVKVRTVGERSDGPIV